MPSVHNLPHHATRFVWDGLRMVSEIDRYNCFTTVYHPDQAYTPLARAHQPQQGGQVYNAHSLRWYHTTPAGTPQQLSEATGHITWKAEYLAWGKTEQEEYKLGQQQNLRFAGQYEDTETGLHYNTFRYYDPQAGRYLTPDPIGLAGGLNLYAYVFDPNSQIDPWGWSGCGVNGAPRAVALTFDKSTRTWTTPAGIDYGLGSVHGNRVQHVLDHAVANPQKTTHSIFNVNRKEVLGLVDDAWLMKSNPLPNDLGAYVVPMGRVVGTAGETSIKIIVRPNTNKIITAYPF